MRRESRPAITHPIEQRYSAVRLLGRLAAVFLFTWHLSIAVASILRAFM